jgi:hypothetical protein
MIFPNIQILTKDKNIYFNDFLNNSIERKTERYSYLRTHYNLDQYTAIIIISQINKTYKKVVNFIKVNNISTIYFFVDDVFRSSLENSFLTLSENFEEIKKIKKIIDKTKIKNYKIFSCEVINEKIFDLEINYADLYLNDFIKTKKNYQLLKKQSLNYKISCLNNRRDVHRLAISALLCDRKHVFITMNDRLPLTHLINNNFFNIKNLDADLINLLYKNINYLNEHFSKFLDPLNYDQTVLKNTIQNNKFSYKIIQNSFLNIVTETCYTSKYINISEKTIKPIMCKRPFLILGIPGSILHLKNLGFKTFNKWWDESYDLELDHAKRLQKVYYIADEILNKSASELEFMLDDMLEILDYNKNHLNKISKNLLPIIHNT